MNWRIVRLIGFLVAVALYVIFKFSGLDSEGSYWRGTAFIAVLSIAGIFILIDILRMRSE